MASIHRQSRLVAKQLSASHLATSPWTCMYPCNAATAWANRLRFSTSRKHSNGTDPGRALRTGRTQMDRSRIAPPSRVLALRRAYSQDHRRRNHAFIALGSNLGDRFDAIETACRSIDSDSDMRITETSSLYETEPMYVQEQGRFLNGVCKIETSLSPIDLLDRLQAIENGLGRVKIIDKGPRNIDLDILTYNDDVISTDRLKVPHALMLEREFVLRPLCDTSGVDFTHPETGYSARDHLSRLSESSTPMHPLVSLGMPNGYIKSTDPRRQTHVMAILNTTPDSFSDGGRHDPHDVHALRHAISSQIDAGARIIDIGGQSSRPNAPDVTAPEEISRILPAIEAFQSLPGHQTAGVALSVDTYRASVARAGIQAGAHIINDISAGMLDADMLPTVAELGCTYVLMHMRGTPATMQNTENTTYPRISRAQAPAHYTKEPGISESEIGLIETVAHELQQRLLAAQQAGIRRWRVILDPGIGFSKKKQQNLSLLRHFPSLRSHPKVAGYPWLIGSSRKRFVGEITGATQPNERDWGTAATVAAAIWGGADIVRVHATRPMREVAQVADAIWRV